MAARLKASDAAIDPFNTAHKPTGFKTTDLSKILRAAHPQSKLATAARKPVSRTGFSSKKQPKDFMCWLLAPKIITLRIVKLLSSN